MQLNLTFAYRANKDEPHPLDDFGNLLDHSLQEASGSLSTQFSRYGKDVAGIEFAAKRIEAPVEDNVAIQHMLLTIQSELRGLLIVDSSVDDALDAIEDNPISELPRVNIYRDLFNLEQNDVKGIPAVLSLAKKEGYTSLCVVLRAIGDHTSLPPNDSDNSLAQRYVSGEMTDASPVHRQLCLVVNRDGLFTSDSVQAIENMAANIRILSLLLQSASQAGFTEEQIIPVSFYDNIPKGKDNMLIVCDRHARTSEEDVAPSEVILPFVASSDGFPEQHEDELLEQMLSSEDHARIVIENCFLPGRKSKWVATASE